MDQYGTITESGTLRFQRLLPGPIETVWQYITDPEKRGKWLASGETNLCEGGDIRFNFTHSNLSAEKETIPEKYKDFKEGSGFTGCILEVNPPKMIRFTWEQGSEVTIELEDQDENVLLTLTHVRLKDDLETKLSVSAGWHTHLNILKDRLEGKEPQGFWKVHMALEKEYTKRLSH